MGAVIVLARDGASISVLPAAPDIPPEPSLLERPDKSLAVETTHLAIPLFL